MISNLRLCILPILILGLFVVVQSTVAQPRQVQQLSAGWQFHKGSLEEGPEDLDQYQWERVSIPHTWNAKDTQDGAPYYKGTGWYQKQISIDSTGKERRVYLRFKGVSICAWSTAKFSQPPELCQT